MTAATVATTTSETTTRRITFSTEVLANAAMRFLETKPSEDGGFATGSLRPRRPSCGLQFNASSTAVLGGCADIGVGRGAP